jgi:hypothetical protein
MFKTLDKRTFAVGISMLSIMGILFVVGLNTYTTAQDDEIEDCESSGFPTCDGDCSGVEECYSFFSNSTCQCLTDEEFEEIIDELLEEEEEEEDDDEPESCGDSEYPACGGDCDIGDCEQKGDDTDTCICKVHIEITSECGETYPACDGECPDGENCEPSYSSSSGYSCHCVSWGGGSDLDPKPSPEPEPDPEPEDCEDLVYPACSGGKCPDDSEYDTCMAILGGISEDSSCGCGTTREVTTIEEEPEEEEFVGLSGASPAEESTGLSHLDTSRNPLQNVQELFQPLTAPFTPPPLPSLSPPPPFAPPPPPTSQCPSHLTELLSTEGRKVCCDLNDPDAGCIDLHTTDQKHEEIQPGEPVQAGEQVQLGEPVKEVEQVPIEEPQGQNFLLNFIRYLFGN